MPIERYKGQPLPITVRFPDNPLTVYGKTYADIEDITMNLKINLQNDDDEQYLQKRQTTNGVNLDEENHRFVMLINQDDYDNLKANQKYLITVNVKVSGMADMIELSIQYKNRAVLITADSNRE